MANFGRWHLRTILKESRGVGEEGATFVYKVKKRRNAASHPQRIAAELKSKNDQTAGKCQSYRIGIAASKILTGQEWNKYRTKTGNFWGQLGTNHLRKDAENRVSEWFDL
jgi:hypothetical protein